MNRRDLLLNEMAISQWVLTKPQVLKGEAQIRLEPQVKLVVICEEDHRHSRLFQDVLCGLQYTPEQYRWLNLAQAMRIHLDERHIPPIFWLIQPPAQAVGFTKKFVKQTAWQYASWQALQQPATKRQLWQQIQPFCREEDKA